jgi:hypothetical protein
MHTTGVVDKGDQAAENVKLEGKKAASDAERSAQEDKYQSGGVSVGESLFTHLSSSC